MILFPCSHYGGYKLCSLCGTKWICTVKIDFSLQRLQAFCFPSVPVLVYKRCVRAPCVSETGPCEVTERTLWHSRGYYFHGHILPHKTESRMLFNFRTGSTRLPLWAERYLVANLSIKTSSVLCVGLWQRSVGTV
jgi:hypothetical protein